MGLKEGGWRVRIEQFPVSGQRGWYVDGRGSMGRRGVDLVHLGSRLGLRVSSLVLHVRVRLR
jgi:hypothetical protein